MLLSATNHSCWPKFVWNLPFQTCIAHTPSISSNNLQLLQLPSISTTPHTHIHLAIQFGNAWLQLVLQKPFALERASLVLEKASLASLGKDPCPGKGFPGLEKGQPSQSWKRPLPLEKVSLVLGESFGKGSRSFGKGPQSFGKGTGALEKAKKALAKAKVGSRKVAVSPLARDKNLQFCLEKGLAAASEILLSHLQS